MKRVTVMALERYRWCAIFVNLLIAHRKIEKKNNREFNFCVIHWRVKSWSHLTTSASTPHRLLPFEYLLRNERYHSAVSSAPHKQRTSWNQLSIFKVGRMCGNFCCLWTNANELLLIDDMLGKSVFVWCPRIVSSAHTIHHSIIIVVDKTITVRSEHEFYNHQKLVSVWQLWPSAVSSHKLFLSFASWQI